jgi:hypothetical protein
MCENPGASFSAAQYFGASFGPGSICVQSSLVQSGV